MSEHRNNPIAVLASMVPPLLPAGHAVQVRLLVDVSPARGVFVVESDEEEKKVMEAWSDANADRPDLPDPVFFRPGQPIPSEHCDAVVVLATSVQDQTRGGIVGLNGKAPKLPTSTVLHTEIARMPLTKWQAAHGQQLKGAK